MVQVVWLSSHRLFYGCAVKKEESEEERELAHWTHTYLVRSWLIARVLVSACTGWENEASPSFSSYLTQVCRLAQYKLICTQSSGWWGIHSVPCSAASGDHEDPLALYSSFPHKNRSSTTQRWPTLSKGKRTATRYLQFISQAAYIPMQRGLENQ